MNSLKTMAENLGIEHPSFANQDLAYAVPLILKIQSEGSTFFMKVDSEREKDVSTIIIEGGLLGDDYIRCETDDIALGVNQVIADYSERFWN